MRHSKYRYSWNYWLNKAETKNRGSIVISEELEPIQDWMNGEICWRGQLSTAPIPGSTHLTVVSEWGTTYQFEDVNTPNNCVYFMTDYKPQKMRVVYLRGEQVNESDILSA